MCWVAETGSWTKQVCADLCPWALHSFVCCTIYLFISGVFHWRPLFWDEKTWWVDSKIDMPFESTFWFWKYLHVRKVKVSKDLGGYRIICGTVFSLNWQRGFTFADTFNTLVHRLEACAMVPIRAHQKHWEWEGFDVTLQSSLAWWWWQNVSDGFGYCYFLIFWYLYTKFLGLSLMWHNVTYFWETRIEFVLYELIGC